MNLLSKENVLFLIALTAAFVIQTYVIYPIEKEIRTDEYANLASYIFIPHGVKVLFCMFAGPLAMLHIFVVQTLNHAMLTGMPFGSTAFISAFIGSVSIALPVAAANKSRNKNLLEPLFFTGDLNYFWTFTSLALISSLFNTFGHTVLYGLSNGAIGFRFIIGDLLGALLIISMVLVCFRMIKNG